MDRFVTGERVELEGFGEGTVVQCNDDGHLVEVAFSETETIIVSGEELKKFDGT